ncbi:Argininosuccinate lyase OS=Streptomyces alboniger OX=132473 GN=argH PE=3 SV=1 [Streptomyces alboniger]
MSSNSGDVRLWGGRFADGPAEALAKLSASVHFDWRLAPYDIAGSRAHARVLHKAGLLTEDELTRMLAGLDRLEADVADGSFVGTIADEDVHTALERGLLERLGPDLGGKLRAGRSRNDQVATLFRMYLRDHARIIGGLIAELQGALIGLAEAHPDVAMPGARTSSTRSRCSSPTTSWPTSSPCRGTRSGCGSGHPHGRVAVRLGRARRVLPGLDPEAVAEELGFERGSAGNSIDGTASRDFVAEFAFITAMIGVNLSRIAEEIIIWNTKEFSFVTLHDAFDRLLECEAALDRSALDEGSARDALRRLVKEIEQAAGLLAFLYTENQLFEGDAQHDGWALIDARLAALFRRGQESGEFRIDLTPAWLTEALYGLIGSGAWAVQDGRVAAKDFSYMIAELLIGGAQRRVDS